MLMSAAVPPSRPKVLEGLKAIAAELEMVWHRPVSVRRAWLYCVSDYDPLPHVKAGREVRAFTERVHDWARRQHLWRRGR